MSFTQINSAQIILEENFGPIVGNVGSVLIQNGPTTLSIIHRASKQCLKEVKDSLTKLIQHSLVSYHLNARQQIEYEIDLQRVIYIQRYPRFMLVAKSIESQYAPILVEHLLLCGQSTLQDMLQRVVNQQLTNADCEDIYAVPRAAFNVLTLLVRNHYVEICPQAGESHVIGNQVKEIDFNQHLDFRPVNERYTDMMDEGVRLKCSKRSLAESNDDSNDSAQWFKLNMERFNRSICERLVVNVIENFYEDAKVGQIAKIMFDLNQNHDAKLSRTSLISACDIVKQAMKSKTFENEFQVENYLKLLTADNKFINCCESTRDGGKFVIDVDYCLDEMVKNHVADYIGEVYGNKSARLFRLLSTKKFVQQKQLEEEAMISAKETRERSYALFRDGFFKLLQYCKTPDYAPSKTCFVFTVDLKDVVPMLVNRCNQMFQMLIFRRNHELMQNGALLEKKKLVDAIITSLGDQDDIEDQVEELNQSFTSTEKVLLSKLDYMLNRFRMSESQLDETLLLLQMWTDNRQGASG